MTDTAISRGLVQKAVPPIANYINIVMIPLSLLLVLLVLTDAHGDFRVWATVALFVLGPGSGLTQFFKLEHASLQFGVLIALSFAADLLVSQLLLGIHNINANAAACILAGITCVRPLSFNQTTASIPQAPRLADKQEGVA